MQLRHMSEKLNIIQKAWYKAHNSGDIKQPLKKKKKERKR